MEIRNIISSEISDISSLSLKNIVMAERSVIMLVSNSLTCINPFMAPFILLKI